MIVVLIILSLLILLFFLSKNSQLTPLQTEFTNKIKPLTDRLNILLNDPDYIKFKELVPGIITYTINKKITITPVTSEGDLNKLNELRDKWPSVLKKCKELIILLEQLIKLAENSVGVYSPEQLKVFVVYYTNFINNTSKIIKYIS
jgi:hypothetical protein